MRTKKMTKQVRLMVEDVNEYLRNRHIKEIGDHRFSEMCYLLLKAGCYHGFNLYTVDGTLSGADPEKFDHLEIYIV